MAFRFKLEAVLSVRRNFEEQAQLRLAGEQVILDGHTKRLADLGTERSLIIDGLEDRKRAGMQASFFSLYVEGIRNKDRQIEAQTAAVEKQRQVVEAARMDLTERVKEREIIERLREKDYRNYLKGLLAVEQKENDDLMVLRFNRHGRPG
jgi:flagellar FliJ protein